MDSFAALPCGDSSRSRCGSTTPIFSSAAKAGSAASTAPAAVTPIIQLLIIGRFTELPTSYVFSFESLGQQPPGLKPLVSRRNRPGGAILHPSAPQNALPTENWNPSVSSPQVRTPSPCLALSGTPKLKRKRPRGASHCTASPTERFRSPKPRKWYCTSHP